MEAHGVLNAVYSAGNPALATRSRLRVTILNATGFPPQLNTSYREENGVWNDVFDSTTRTLRLSVV